MDKLIIITPLLSSLIVFLLYIPFINILYALKFKLNPDQKKKDIFGKSTSIFNKLHGHKGGTPIGGGILIVIYMLIFNFSVAKLYDLPLLTNILLCFFLFGLIGFYDDFTKIFEKTKTTFGLRVRHKFLIQTVVALVVSYFFIVNTSSEPLTIIPNLIIISSVAVKFALLFLSILFFTNAFNITDGLDGLSAGSLILSLIPLALVSYFTQNLPSGFFITSLIGSLVAYLYFNVPPARIFMGDTGALAFGSTFALLCFINNVFYLLPFLGFLYIIEGLSSLIQWTSKKYRNKKVFNIAPFHHHLESLGWDESKVTMRLWLLQAFFSLIGLTIYLFINI